MAAPPKNTPLSKPRNPTSQTSSGFEITVVPSDQLFEELGNNTYDLLDAVSELIDNSVAAAPPKGAYKVTITFSYSANANNETFEIVDNCLGIPRSYLGKAISPAALSGDGLNEHGLGMKQAVASIGKLKKLVTKSADDTEGTEIHKFAWKVKGRSVRSVKRGTMILVGDLRQRVAATTEKQKLFSAQLGARYRRFIGSDDPLNLDVIFKNLDKGTSSMFAVVPIGPIYFNPDLRKNRPSFEKDLKGHGWRAHLRIGFAPDSDAEYRELKLDRPERGMPYSLSAKNAGIDLIRHDRVIRFHVLEPYFTETRHNQYNLIRGELELLSGFHTAITKNAITADGAFEDCMSQVREFINDQEILAKRHSYGHIPENVLRNRLANALQSPPHNKTQVVKEVAVGDLDGHIDVLADGIPYEVKAGEAAGLDLYQLFAYMDLRNYDKGYLVAQSFTPSVQPVINHLKKKHHVEIQAVLASSYGITYMQTQEEIDSARSRKK